MDAQDISKVGGKLFVFFFLMMGRNSLIIPDLFDKMRNEVVIRYNARKITARDFSEVVASLHYLNAMDEELLKKLGILDGSFKDHFGSELSVKDNVLITFNLLTYADLIPESYFAGFFKYIQ
jgi:hypothetical protein